jgi:hypothetical protein
MNDPANASQILEFLLRGCMIMMLAGMGVRRKQDELCSENHAAPELIHLLLARDANRNP